MSTADPWAFGLNHLLTIFGFLITLAIATAGFRSFDKWKREKIEERRLDIALEALALAYEAGSIFDSIRSPMSYEGEWAELKIEDQQRRLAAGPFFAVLKRIEHHKDFFDRVWKTQPQFMAVFGKEAAGIFKNLHQARRRIEVSAGTLMRDTMRERPMSNQEFREKLENDVWPTDDENDRIVPQLIAFIAGIEEHCLPIVTYRYSKK